MKSQEADYFHYQVKGAPFEGHIGRVITDHAPSYCYLRYPCFKIWDLPRPSISQLSPAFVSPQPIASSVKNGSVTHLEGDETFIGGLFLFLSFFSLRHGEGLH